MFSVLVSGIMLDLFVKIDLDKLVFEYRNNSASVYVIILIVFTSIIFISYNFWLEKLKIKERTNKEILDIIKNPQISDRIKKDLLKIIKSNH